MADVSLAKPQAGQLQNVPSEEGARFVLDFPSDQGKLARNGDDLQIQFEDGAAINIENFYGKYNSESMPSFKVGDQEVSGQDFFAAMNEPDLMPAAGPGGTTSPAASQVGRGGRYNDWANSDLGGGIDHLTRLDYSSDRHFEWDQPGWITSPDYEGWYGNWQPASDTSAQTGTVSTAQAPAAATPSYIPGMTPPAYIPAQPASPDLPPVETPPSITPPTADIPPQPEGPENPDLPPAETPPSSTPPEAVIPPQPEEPGNPDLPPASQNTTPGVDVPSAGPREPGHPGNPPSDPSNPGKPGDPGDPGNPGGDPNDPNNPASPSFIHAGDSTIVVDEGALDPDGSSQHAFHGASGHGVVYLDVHGEGNGRAVFTLTDGAGNKVVFNQMGADPVSGETVTPDAAPDLFVNGVRITVTGASYDAATGKWAVEYDYALTGQQEHGIPGSETDNVLAFDEGVKVEVTDASGDSSESFISVEIHDDVPVLAPITGDELIADTASEVKVQINGLDFGADAAAAKYVVVNVDGTDYRFTASEGGVDGDYLLTAIDANAPVSLESLGAGNYTLTYHRPEADIQKAELKEGDNLGTDAYKFTVTVVDSDGDAVSQEYVVATNAAPGVTVVPNDPREDPEDNPKDPDPENKNPNDPSDPSNPGEPGDPGDPGNPGGDPNDPNNPASPSFIHAGDSTIVVDEGALDPDGSSQHTFHGASGHGVVYLDVHGEGNGRAEFTLTDGAGNKVVFNQMGADPVSGETVTPDAAPDLFVNGVRITVTGASYDAATGKWTVEYDYALTGQQEHGIPGSETDNVLAFNEGVKVEVTDASGDTATGVISVEIHDDVPVLEQIAGHRIIDDKAESVTLQINGLDFGADAAAAKYVVVNVDGTDYRFTASEGGVDGDYLLTAIDANAPVSLESLGAGNYTLTYHRPEADIQKAELKEGDNLGTDAYKFTVTVVDSDGDAVSQEYVVATNAAPGVTVVPNDPREDPEDNPKEQDPENKDPNDPQSSSFIHAGDSTIVVDEGALDPAGSGQHTFHGASGHGVVYLDVHGEGNGRAEFTLTDGAGNKVVFNQMGADPVSGNKVAPNEAPTLLVNGVEIAVTGAAYDAATGKWAVEYDYTLTGNQEHGLPGSKTDNVLAFDKGVKVEVTDASGDRAEGFISVEIHDDVPEMTVERAQFNEDDFAQLSEEAKANFVNSSSIRGEFEVNYGADGAASEQPLHIQIDNGPLLDLNFSNGQAIFEIEGKGFLKISEGADGKFDYVFVPIKGYDNSVEAEFTVFAKDSDLDETSAATKVDINFRPKFIPDPKGETPEQPTDPDDPGKDPDNPLSPDDSGNDPDNPVLATPDGAGLIIRVDEASLAGKTDANARHGHEGSHTFAVKINGNEDGTVTIGGKDGITLDVAHDANGNYIIAGTAGFTDGVRVFEANGMKVSFNASDISIDNNGQVNVTFNYELTDNQAHGKAEDYTAGKVNGHLDALQAMQLLVEVVDSIGQDKASGTLTFEIHDDGPQVTAGDAVQLERGDVPDNLQPILPDDLDGMSLAGNFRVDYGADNEPGQTSLEIDGQKLTFVNGVAQAELDDGIMTVTDNGGGAYSYKFTPNEYETGERVFAVKATDSDGDIATANIAVNLDFKPEIPPTDPRNPEDPENPGDDPNNPPRPESHAPEGSTVHFVMDEGDLANGSGVHTTHPASSNTSFNVRFNGGETGEILIGEGANACKIVITENPATHALSTTIYQATLDAAGNQVFTAAGADGVRVSTANNVNINVTGIEQGSGKGEWTVKLAYELTDRVEHKAVEGYAEKTGAEDYLNDFAPINILVTDQTGDTATGKITYEIHDDGPKAHDDFGGTLGIRVAEDGTKTEVATTKGNVLDNDSAGADGLVANPVTWANAENGVILGEYGTLTANADGTWTYNLDVDNPDYQALKFADKPLQETFSYTIVDRDGDTSSATLTIDIKGNEPVTVTPNDPDPKVPGGDPAHPDVPGASVTVREENLADGTNPNTDALTQSGYLNVTAPDGVASITFGGVEIALDGSKTEIPTHDEGVLQVSYKDGQIHYEYTLNQATTEHPGKGVGEPGKDTFAHGDYRIVVTDNDGDTASSNFRLNIVDDVPEAKNDFGGTVGVTGKNDDGSKNIELTRAGNVLDNDTFGADGLAENPVAWAEAKNDVIQGQYGKLTANADGTWRYELDTNNEAYKALKFEDAPLQETFNYTLTDRDGDTSSATLTINIKGNQPVTVTPNDPDPKVPGGDPAHPDVPGASVTVREEDLENGSATEKENLTKTGSLDVTAPDGVASITFGGVEIALDGSKTEIPTHDEGVLQVSYKDGQIHYEYTLNQATTEHTAAGKDTISHGDYKIVVTDNDGDTASSNFRINIVDDVPEAKNDSGGTVGVTGKNDDGSENIELTRAGNVLDNDTSGADGLAENPVAWAEATNDVIQGQYGKLTANADGTWRYELDTNNEAYKALKFEDAPLQETFNYTLTDRDGDTSSAKLTIDIKGNQTVNVQGASVKVKEENLTNGTNATEDALAQSGSLKVTAPDGVKSIKFGGTDLDVEKGEATTFNTDQGVLTVYYKAGQIHYEYTLNQASTHPEADKDTISLPEYEIVVTDNDGDTASSNFRIDIVDDMPLLQSHEYESNKVTAGEKLSFVIPGKDATSDQSAFKGLEGFQANNEPVPGINGEHWVQIQGVKVIATYAGYRFGEGSDGIVEAFDWNSNVSTSDGNTKYPFANKNLTIGENGLGRGDSSTASNTEFGVTQYQPNTNGWEKYGGDQAAWENSSVVSEAITLEPINGSVSYGLNITFGNFDADERAIATFYLTPQNNNDNSLVKIVEITREMLDGTGSLKIDVPDGYTKVLIGALPKENSSDNAQVHPTSFTIKELEFTRPAYGYQGNVTVTAGADGLADDGQLAFDLAAMQKALADKQFAVFSPLAEGIYLTDKENNGDDNLVTPGVGLYGIELEENESTGKIEAKLTSNTEGAELKGHTLFTLELDRTNWNIEQSLNFREVKPGENGTWEIQSDANVQLVFKATDADGDTATTQIPVNMNHDYKFDRFENVLMSSFKETAALKDTATDFLYGREGLKIGADGEIGRGELDDLIYGRGGDDVLVGDGGEQALTDIRTALGLQGESGNTKSDQEALRDALKQKIKDDHDYDPLADEQFQEGGNDAIMGGVGEDIVLAMGGDDFIDGGRFKSYVGEYTPDKVTADHDMLFGGAGNDIIVYDQGDYVINGGSGIDILLAGKDAPSLNEVLSGAYQPHEAGTIADNRPIISQVEAVLKTTVNANSDAMAITSHEALREFGISVEGDRLVLDDSIWVRTAGTGGTTVYTVKTEQPESTSSDWKRASELKLELEVSNDTKVKLNGEGVEATEGNDDISITGSGAVHALAGDDTVRGSDNHGDIIYGDEGDDKLYGGDNGHINVSANLAFMVDVKSSDLPAVKQNLQAMLGNLQDQLASNDGTVNVLIMGFDTVAKNVVELTYASESGWQIMNMDAGETGDPVSEAIKLATESSIKGLNTNGSNYELAMSYAKGWFDAKAEQNPEASSKAFLISENNPGRSVQTDMLPGGDGFYGGVGGSFAGASFQKNCVMTGNKDGFSYKATFSFVKKYDDDIEVTWDSKNGNIVLDDYTPGEKAFFTLQSEVTGEGPLADTYTQRFYIDTDGIVKWAIGHDETTADGTVNWVQDPGSTANLLWGRPWDDRNIERNDGQAVGGKTDVLPTVAIEENGTWKIGFVRNVEDVASSTNEAQTVLEALSKEDYEITLVNTPEGTLKEMPHASLEEVSSLIENLFPEAPHDYLYGGEGSDYLDGGAGADYLYGGEGDDILVFDMADKIIDGGEGFDILLVGKDHEDKSLADLEAHNVKNIEMVIRSNNEKSPAELELRSVASLAAIGLTVADGRVQIDSEFWDLEDQTADSKIFTYTGDTGHELTVEISNTALGAPGETPVMLTMDEHTTLRTSSHDVGLLNASALRVATSGDSDTVHAAGGVKAARLGFDWIDEGEGNDIIIFDQTDVVVDGGDRQIDFLVARADADVSLKDLLENGASDTPKDDLPMVRDVEVLIKGDIDNITDASQLEALNIKVDDDSGTLKLGAGWKLVQGEDNAAEADSGFETTTWRLDGNEITLETTLKGDALEQTDEDFGGLFAESSTPADTDETLIASGAETEEEADASADAMQLSEETAPAVSDAAEEAAEANSGESEPAATILADQAVVADLPESLDAEQTGAGDETSTVAQTTSEDSLKDGAEESGAQPRASASTLRLLGRNEEASKIDGKPEEADTTPDNLPEITAVTIVPEVDTLAADTSTAETTINS